MGVKVAVIRGLMLWNSNELQLIVVEPENNGNLWKMLKLNTYSSYIYLYLSELCLNLLAHEAVIRQSPRNF